MKKFEFPDIEVVKFTVTDIIATSNDPVIPLTMGLGHCLPYD